MAYHVFNGTAVQVRQVRKLQEYLLGAQQICENMDAQTTQMVLADIQTQFGVPTSVTETQWRNILSQLDTLLADSAVTILTTQIGFTS